MTSKAIRTGAKKSQLQVAAESNTSLPTVRLYEADRSAVREDKRAALDAVYERLERELQAGKKRVKK